MLAAAVARLRRRAPDWVWWTGLTILWGVGIVLYACTVHDRCEASDPACIFHSYTLLQDVGPGVLGFVGAPLAISLVLAPLLHRKTTRGGYRVDQATWALVMLGGLVCLVGLVVVGLVMAPWVAFAVCAAATSPSAPVPL